MFIHTSKYPTETNNVKETRGIPGKKSLCVSGEVAEWDSLEPVFFFFFLAYTQASGKEGGRAL